MTLTKKLIQVFREDQRPFRRIFSRVLLRIPQPSTPLVRVRVRDYSIYLHQSSLAAEFWYNPAARSSDYLFLTTYLRPSDVYIDVGANIGTTVIPAAKRVTRGHVLAFEPHPRTYLFLQQNLRLNGLSNVDARNCAVGQNAGVIMFSDKLSDDQNHPTEGPGSIQVGVIPLDQVTADLEHIALLKIDVEGYEKSVLDGGSATLDKTECVYFEVSEQNANRYGYTTSELLGTLESRGFSLFKRAGRGRLAQIALDYRPSGRSGNALAIKNVDAFLDRTGWNIHSV